MFVLDVIHVYLFLSSTLCQNLCDFSVYVLHYCLIFSTRHNIFINASGVFAHFDELVYVQCHPIFVRISRLYKCVEIRRTSLFSNHGVCATETLTDKTKNKNKRDVDGKKDMMEPVDRHQGMKYVARCVILVAHTPVIN